MDNLDILVKSLNRLENYTAKYIYKKYIETVDIPILIDTPKKETPDENIELEEIIHEKFKYNSKPKNKEEYKVYKDIIFGKERKNIITQDELLKQDLENMNIADKEYSLKKSLFNRKNYDSYPDEKRCSYIRKIKHKLIRCKNSIMNDDEDVCCIHEDTPNIYWDMYNEYLEKMVKT